jgi:hypothetical protein
LNNQSKPLWISGWLLILLGLAHVPFLLAGDGGWEGSVSWRKPILFGVSTGMTLCSLGWLAGHLSKRSLDTFFAWATSISLVVEVGLITLQRWRGVASHFNHATAFDTQVDHAMLVLICVAVVGILYFCVRSFGKLSLDADYLIAIRSGMIFLVASCVIGFVISVYGYQQVAANLSPETVGNSGVAKFPHGVAIHALQILPAIVWGMRRFKFQRWQTKIVTWSASISFAFQIAFACYQTANGLGRFQLETTTSVLLVVLALLTAALPITAFSLNKMLRHSA